MNFATVWLLTVALHGSVLLGMALLVERFVRRDSWRELLWRCALFGGVLTATLQIASQHVPLGGRWALETAAPLPATMSIPERMQASGGSAPSVTAPSVHVVQTPVISSGPLSIEPAQESWREAWTLRWPKILMYIWLGGALFALLRIAVALSRLRGDTRGARPLQDSQLVADAHALAAAAGTPAPQLFELEGLASPIALTGRRIVLPTWAVATLEPASLRAMLAHELGHLVRRDPFGKLFTACWRALFWFLPLAGVAQRRLDDIAELACDAFAARHTGDVRELAECLAACGEHHVSGPALQLAPAMATRASSLLKRIERLLEGVDMDNHLHLGAGARIGAAAALAVAAFCLPAIGVDVARADTPPAAATPKATKSEHSSSSSSSTSHISFTDDSGHNRSVISMSDEHHKFSANIDGKIAFTDDESDVQSLAGKATFEGTRDGVERRIDLRDRNGQLERHYYVDMKEQPYDDAARAWMKQVVLELMRSGIGAEARVQRLYSQGGAARVLAEIDEIPSDYVRRIYIVQLVELGKLGNGELDRVIAQAGAMSSDYERRQALTAIFDKQMLDAQRQVSFLHQALRFDGDYERAELLIGVLPRLADSGEVRQAWLDAGLQVKADYERRRTLEAMVARGLDDKQLASVIEAGGSIESDYEKRTLLMAVAQHAHDIDALAPAYAKALQNVHSDYEHREALLALIHSGRLTVRGVPAVLESAAQIKAPYECREVLVALAPSIEGDAALVARYRQIAGGLPEYERSEAERVLRR